MVCCISRIKVLTKRPSNKSVFGVGRVFSAPVSFNPFVSDFVYVNLHFGG